MIEIYYDGKKKNFKTFTFPGGEEHIRVEADHPAEYKVTVHAYLYNSSDLMKLILLVDVLKSRNKVPIHLVLPYIPYARQDRQTSSLELFTL